MRHFPSFSVRAPSAEQPTSVEHIVSTDVINWTEALNSVDGDVDLLRVVAVALLAEAPEHLCDLARAVRLSSGDAATVNRAWGISSKELSVRTYEAVAASVAGRAARDDGPTKGDLSDAADCVREFQIRMRNVMNVLKSFVEGRINPTSGANGRYNRVDLFGAGEIEIVTNAS